VEDFMHTHIMRNLLLIARQMFLTGLFLCTPFVVTAENFDAGIFEFQQKLADSGNAQAQFKVGNMYESGRGVGLDLAAATQWYEKSAANNYKPAKNRLTYLQVKRGGFRPEHKNWLNEVKTDADAGDGEASMMLGEMYEGGVGVPKNLAQAQVEYKRASVKGIPGSEGAYYAVSDLLNKQKQQTQQEEEKRMAAEKARKDEAERDAQRKKGLQEQELQKQAQVKAENEQRKLEEDRRRLEAQKRQQEEQKKDRVQAQQKPGEEKPVAEKPAETFESDLCTGKAASFRTQCR
jgi:TPR repeat protein